MCMSGKGGKYHDAGVAKERRLCNLLGLAQESISIIKSIKAFCEKLQNKEREGFPLGQGT